MTMKKRITSFALVLLMVLSSLAVLLPVMGVKTAAAEEKTYTKVTAAPTDWSGEYLIVYEAGSYAFNGVDKGKTQVKIANGKIVATDAVEFEIASMESGYSIKIVGGTNDGKYLGHTSKSNDVAIGTSEMSNTLSMSGENVNITSGDYTLKFNTSAGYFRYYKSGQQAIQLYKLVEESGGESGGGETPCSHDYDNNDWKHDNDFHWHECTKCGAQVDKAAHVDGSDKDCATCGRKASSGDVTEKDYVARFELGKDGTGHYDGGSAGATYTEDNNGYTLNLSSMSKVFQNARDAKGNGCLKLGNSSTGGSFTLTVPEGVTSVVFYVARYTNKTDDLTITVTVKDGETVITEEKNSVTTQSNDGEYNKITINTTPGQTLTFDSGKKRCMVNAIEFKADSSSDYISSATLELGMKNINMNYYVTIPDGVSYDSYVMRFTFNGKTFDVAGVDDPKGLKFTFKDIGPHQMGLNISAELYGVNEDGETKLSEKATYSVKENLESLLTSESETVRTLAQNMLIYGAAAQKYTGAADSELVTKETHAKTPDLADTNAATVENIGEYVKFVGMVLYFDSEPRLAINYKLLKDVPEGKELTFTDVDNNLLKHDSEYVYLNGVTADKFAEENMISNSLDDSVVMFTVNTYIYYVINSEKTSTEMKALATALYYYGVAAEAYVATQTNAQ